MGQAAMKLFSTFFREWHQPLCALSLSGSLAHEQLQPALGIILSNGAGKARIMAGPDDNQGHPETAGRVLC